MKEWKQPSLAVEYTEPDFCMLCAIVWAAGLIGGLKQHLGFKATVVGARAWTRSYSGFYRGCIFRQGS